MTFQLMPKDWIINSWVSNNRGMMASYYKNLSWLGKIKWKWFGIIS